MDNFKRKAIVSLFSSYASQFITMTTTIASKLILARFIAPGDLGVYALALMVLMACDVVVDLGVSKHLIREKQRPYGNLLMLRLMIGALLFTGIQLGANGMSFWGAEFPPVIRAMAVITLIKAVSWVPSLFLERELLIQKSVLPQALRLLTTAIVSIALAYFGHKVWALVFGAIAGEIAFAVTIWHAAARRMPLEWTWKHTRSLVWDSRFLFLIACMGFALQQGDVGIIGTLLSSKQLGYYSMAYTMVIMISRMVEASIFRVVYPMFCEYRDDLRNLGRIYRFSTLVITAVEAPIFFYLLFNAPALTSMLLGEKWMPAAFLMQALSISGIINPFSTFGMEVLRARKQDKILTISTTLSAVTLLTAGYLLTSRYGAVGMVAANYIIIGSLPIILTVYRILKPDFRKLAGQLGMVYATSFAAIALVSAALSSVPYVQAVVAALVVPVCWYVYYRMFGNGMGRDTIAALLTHKSAGAEA